MSSSFPSLIALVGVSPARGGWQNAASALAVVEQVQRDKHSEVFARHGFDLVPFGFSVFRSFGPAAHELLVRVCRRYRTHARIAKWEAHSRVHRRLSFATMRGVADYARGGDDMS